MRTGRRRAAERRGMAIIEFAAVAPVLFLVVFSTIEFGRVFMAIQSLEEASRSGCRVAILRGTTTSEIEAEVTRVLAPAGISNVKVSTIPQNVTTAARWAPVSVTVAASFDSMSWLPLPQYLSGRTYTSSCTMPKEYSTGG